MNRMNCDLIMLCSEEDFTKKLNVHRIRRIKSINNKGMINWRFSFIAEVCRCCRYFLFSLRATFYYVLLAVILSIDWEILDRVSLKLLPHLLWVVECFVFLRVWLLLHWDDSQQKRVRLEQCRDDIGRNSLLLFYTLKRGNGQFLIFNSNKLFEIRELNWELIFVG